MVSINFYDRTEVQNDLFIFAVIAAEYDGKWIFCRHKERTTWEIPGGHREPGEDISITAERELREETGAAEFDIYPVNAYSITIDGNTRYGMLFYSRVRSLGILPLEMEIGEIMLSDTMPRDLTYPDIQPVLYEHVKNSLIRY